MGDSPLDRLRAVRGTRLVGVVNATPDSFSDAHPTTASAVDRGLLLLEHGADLLDVGGESTRPGALRVDVPEELRRVLPVVRELVAAGAAVSIDTTRPAVAAACLEAGAIVVNDVSGGLADPAMLPLLAGSDCLCVLMHWRGPSVDMATRAHYDDVVADVATALRERQAAAVSTGIALDRLVLDPGLGFAKTGAHNWALLHALGELPGPVLVGASRKRFLGELLDGRDTADRDVATAAISLLAAQAGAWGVRVHDVRSSADALAVLGAVAAPAQVPV